MIHLPFALVKAFPLWLFIAGILGIVAIPLMFVNEGLNMMTAGGAVVLLGINVALMLPLLLLNRRHSAHLSSRI